MKFIIHTDGGARGNPGPAAVGVVIEKVYSSQFIVHSNPELIIEFGKRIGETTNNVAEYVAVLEGLRYLKSQIPNLNDQIKKIFEIQFYLDSTLVVNQLNGLFKVKDARLRELLTRVRLLEQEIGGAITYTAIPREQNTHADTLVNQALDM